MEIVREALARYRVPGSRGQGTGPRRLVQELKDRYGIASARGAVYSANAAKSWADGYAVPPSNVLLAIARLTNQSLDAPLGMADEVTERINAVTKEVEAIKAMMGRAARDRSRGKRGTSPSGTSS